jgi:tetratricopeptide (TPR) repeat protein
LTATQDLLAGELESAERHILASMQLADRVRAPDVALEMQAQFVYLRIEQGRAGEIEPATREQVRRFPEQPAWRAAHGRVLVACGRVVEAKALLELLASKGFSDVPQDRVWIGTHALAAEVAYACGDRRVAGMIEPILAPYAALGALLSSVLYYGPVAHHLGLVCAIQEKWDAAIAHFEAALEIESRLCAHVFAARSRVALARTLRSRDSGGDRARAVSLVSDVLATADRQGLVEIAAEARALEQDLWKGPSRGSARRRAAPAE